MPRGASATRARAGLTDRLRKRRGEIEEALLTRTYAIADPKEAADPEYEQGLRAAVSAALDYGLAAVEQGEERAPQVPVLLLAQARLAARNGVPLDTVLRRYFAGYTLLGDFIVQEAGAVKLSEAGLKRLLRDQAATFDRLLATIAEEHAREGSMGRGSTEGRRSERIERLLGGELVDTGEFSYDFKGAHIGAIASGPGVREALGELAAALDRRLLLVPRADETVWVWLGGRRQIDPVDVEEFILASWPAGISLVIGESGRRLEGWRLTHRQARTAFPIARRRGAPFTRYAEVALLATASQDELFSASLRELYLAPLQRDRDGGKVALETLRAYFDAERNTSSAAALLGVNRNTVTTRLRTIEAKVGRPLGDCAAEFDVALRLDELGGSGS